MMPSDIFDRVYVIHLPVRQTGLQGTLIYAQPPPADFYVGNMRRNPPVEFGINLSHIKAVATAISDGAERPLFLEDDVEFIGEPDLSALPEYDVLYLGGHPRERVTPVSDGLVKVGRFSFAEAYSISRRALLPFFGYWCDRISRPDAMYDFILGEFAAQNAGFAVYPPATRQRNIVSLVDGQAAYDRVAAKKDGGKPALVMRGWAANLSTR